MPRPDKFPEFDAPDGADERERRAARARLTHAVDQSGASLRHAATLLGEMWCGLVEAGVESNAATFITVEYMKHAIPGAARPDGGTL